MAKKRKNAADEQHGESSSQSLYEILGVERTATQEEIRKAYHKLALRLHPDKNPGDKEANSKFQSLQSVFAVLGDPEKRAVYDETGSVEDMDLVGESGKSLYEFFRALYKTVTEKDIEEFAASYRGSEQETEDLKELYTSCKGNMNKVFQMLMCSDPGLDSHRFMEVVDAAIAAGELEEKRSYRKWAKETAKRPAPADPLAPRKSKEEAASSDLVAAIRTKGQQNMDSLVSALEAKYSKKHKQPAEEPSEEAFQAARAKMNARKARKK